MELLLGFLIILGPPLVPVYVMYRIHRRDEQEAADLKRAAIIHSRLADHLKYLAALILILFGASANAQMVQSSLSNAPVGGAGLVTPYNEATSVLAVGKFSSPSQTLDDIVTIDVKNNLVCLQNNGGVFSTITTPTGIPTTLDVFGGVFTFAQTVSLGTTTAPATDFLFYGTYTNTSSASSANCVFGQSIDTSIYQGQVGSVSKDSAGNILCATMGVSTADRNLNGCSLGASWIVGLPAPVPDGQTTQSFLLFLQTPWAQTGGPGAGFPATLFQGPGSALSGDIYLNTIFFPQAIFVVTSTDTQVFIDSVSTTSLLPTGNLESLSVGSTNVVGAVFGNFLGGVYDLAVCNGSEVDYFSYANGFWTFAFTQNVGATITACAHGPVVPGDADDVVVEAAGSAVVLGSASVGFPNNGAPPQNFTLTVNVVGPGSTNIPNGVSYPAGTQVLINETPNTNNTFSAWSGACAGSASTCTVAMTANQTVTATFSTTPPPPPPPPPSALTITVTPESQTTSAGTVVTYQVTAANNVGAVTINAACPTLGAAKGSCSTAGMILTASSTAPTTGSMPATRFPLWPALGLGVLAWIIAPRRRRMTLAFGLIFLCGCAGGGSNNKTSNPPPAPTVVPGTPSGTYQISVTATDSKGNTAPATATVVIQ